MNQKRTIHETANSSQRVKESWQDSSHTPNLFGAFFFILIGILFLLNSFDILSWDV